MFAHPVLNAGVIRTCMKRETDKMPPYWDRIPLPGFYNKFVCSVFPVKACLLFVGMNKKTTFTPFEPQQEA